jgi:hypothetical protein
LPEAELPVREVATQVEVDWTEVATELVERVVLTGTGEEVVVLTGGETDEVEVGGVMTVSGVGET